jgi:O-antigen/teichoic acid export membrane protein
MHKKINKVLHDSNFLSLTGNLVSAVLGAASFMLLTRTYEISIFGEWILFLTMSTFIEMFRFGLTKTALVRFLSGAEPTEWKRLVGANYVIGIILTILIAIVLYVCLWLFYQPIASKGYLMFFVWYPILAVVNLPFNNALTVLQAEDKFSEMLVIRLLSGFLFVFILGGNLLFGLNIGLQSMIISYLVVNLITSILVLIKNWDGLIYLFHANKASIKLLLDFGKYTTVTMIGSNLLRSADTLIISLSPLGASAVALYSIPMKLNEVIQIPLRSFTATAFPRMSKASIQGDKQTVRDVFYHYSGLMTFMFIPMALAGYFFSEYLVLILGGQQYLKPDPTTGASAIVLFQIFSLSALMLPIDRLTGVGLDAINKPKKNFYKILVMVAANVIGDLIAVFYFKSLIGVAWATIFFTFLGVVVGYKYLDNEIGLTFKYIFTKSWKMIISLGSGSNPYWKN